MTEKAEIKSEKVIYGVDITKKVTPIMVRDAIIECFTLAHSYVLEEEKEHFNYESAEKFEKFKKETIIDTIKSIFEELGGDFNNPTKEDLIELVTKLEQLASMYRSREVIERHASEIMQLITKLD